MILSRPLFSYFTLSAVYSFPDGAASYVISSPCLTSLRLWTFLGSYKQLRQPRQAFVYLFPVCINIYQAGKHGHVTGMTWCLCDAWGWDDLFRITIWSVALKQSAGNQEGRTRLGNPIFVVQVSVVCTLSGRLYISIVSSNMGFNCDQHMGNMDLRLFQINCTKYSLADVTLFRNP